MDRFLRQGTLTRHPLQGYPSWSRTDMFHERYLGEIFSKINTCFDLICDGMCIDMDVGGGRRGSLPRKIPLNSRIYGQEKERNKKYTNSKTLLNVNVDENFVSLLTFRVNADDDDNDESLIYFLKMCRRRWIG